MCCVLMVTSLVFSVSSVYAATVSESQFANKIAELKTIFRDKEYWNAYNLVKYEGTGTTKGYCSGPCAASCSCKCGKFYYNNSYVGGQCFGFANKMAYLIFGSVPELHWTKYTSVDNYYAGDYVRVRNDRHSIFITKVQGDTITYVDCNNIGPCQVKWDRQISKSSLKSVTTYVRHLSGNILTGTGTVPPPVPDKEEVIWTVDNRYHTPITAYPLATYGQINVYNSNLVAYDHATRHIAAADLCTINTVYTNGYCSVTYPTVNGSNTEYAKTSDFIAGNVTPYAWKPSQNISAYTRSDMSTVFGEVYTTDNCTAVGSSGSKLQIIYPLNAGGYKLGWVDATVIPPSDFPTPMKGFNASSTADTTVYESLSTMGTYYGEIFPSDECTLNSVNISGGWIHVTYPASGTYKSGYVYLSEFVPSSSKLTHFYKTTVTQQSDTFRKADMATKYGWVRVGDEVIVVGKSGNKLQILYPLDAQYGGGYKIAWMYDTYIKKNLTGISVTSNPSKVTYLEGESLNTNGLVITAKYDDGSTSNVTSSCTLSGYSNTPGVKTVTATYNGKQTAFTVTVNTKSPTKLTIESTPSKTVYSVGDTIETTGLKAKVTYNNNTYSTFTDVDGLDIVYDDSITATAGTKKITVSYVYNNVEVSSEFSITVKEVETPTPATYTITYNANGGTNAPASQTKTENVNLVLTKSTPTRNGYTFKGWATTASSQTVSYKPGATYTANSNVTLYAVWEKNNVNVNGPKFVISNSSARVGSTVTVDISIKNNPGITAFNFAIDFPKDILTLTNVEYKDLFSSRALGSQNLTNPFTVSWFSMRSENETANGVIATLKFLVNKNVKKGNYPITLTYDRDNVFNASFTNVEFSVDNGEIAVIDYISGDVNGDTKVNMKDIVLLQQYLNGWGVEIDINAANVNADASVNMKDIVLLQQYLNGWNVTLK